MLDSLDTLIAFVLIMLVVSLLITIAVQMIASLLNLRGLNLLSGLASTFAVIDPGIEKDRKKLARFVLKGRFLSDSFLPNWKVLSWWRRASAVRPDEVFDAIKRIAIGKETLDEPVLNRLWKKIKQFVTSKEPVDKRAALVRNAKNLLIALGVDGRTIDDAATKITDAGKTAETLAAETAAAMQVVSAAKASFDAAREKFKDWADIAQERAQQWFTMHTRVWTAIFAIIAAFGLQLDTVEIFKLVSSNRGVRDKLVAQAGVVEAQAARVLGDSTRVLKDALKAWSVKQTDPAIKSALAGIEVKDTDTRESVRDKVTTVLDGKNPIDSFDATVNDTAIKRVKEQAGDFNVVKADFDKTGFQLFPNSDKGRWEEVGWVGGWKTHVIGILFSAGLLSLGAPFWYNSLKNLVSLRSTVAQNIAQEKQTQAQPDGNKPKPPPPTAT